MELNLAECAEFFGVTTKTARTWFNNGCPVVNRGSQRTPWVIDSVQVSDWLRKRERQEVAGDIEQTDLEEARRRKLAAEAALAELELETKRGDVIPIDDVARAVAKEYAAVRAKLLSLPTKLAALMPAKSRSKYRDLLDDAVRECLDELAAATTDEAGAK